MQTNVLFVFKTRRINRRRRNIFRPFLLSSYNWTCHMFQLSLYLSLTTILLGSCHLASQQPALTCGLTKNLANGLDTFDIASQYTKRPNPPEPKLLSNNFEQRNNLKIINGKLALANQIPWQIFLSVAQGSETAFCGGSILSSRFVLTAGHCVTDINEETTTVNDASAFTVYAGGVIFPGDQFPVSADDGCSTSVKVKKVTRHPDYYIQYAFTEAFPARNDLAILELSEPLDLDSPCMGSICLPRRRSSSSSTGQCNNDAKLTPPPPLPGQLLAVSGYGCTAQDRVTAMCIGPYFAPLSWTRLKFVDDRAYNCLGNVSATPIDQFNQYRCDVLCATGKVDDTSICSGDSGGALVGIDPRTYRHYVLGVNSYVYPDLCILDDYPDFFAEVLSYVDSFILPIVQDAQVMDFP